MDFRNNEIKVGRRISLRSADVYRKIRLRFADYRRIGYVKIFPSILNSGMPRNKEQNNY